MRFPTARKILNEKGILFDSEILKDCPEWLRKAYLMDINHCEHTQCKNGSLEIHRIKRNWEGGLYEPDNVKVCCSIHHSYYHASEFPNCKSK